MNKLAGIIGGLGVLGVGTLGTAQLTGNLPTQQKTPLQEEMLDQANFPPLFQKSASSMSRAEQAMAEETQAFSGRDAIEFCLTWQGDGTTCISRRDLLARAANPLTKRRAPARQRTATSQRNSIKPIEIPMLVSLVDPVDYKAPEQEVRDCTTFNKLKAKGWGGLTSADMADEQWFMVRCGLYKMAEQAELPKRTVFVNSRLSSDDLRTINMADWPYLGEVPEEGMTLSLRKPASLTTYEDSERFWVARYGNMQALVSEIAHADFTNDGVGDILVLINTRQKGGGTARLSFYAIIEKPADTATLREAPVY